MSQTYAQNRRTVIMRPVKINFTFKRPVFPLDIYVINKSARFFISTVSDARKIVIVRSMKINFPLEQPVFSLDIYYVNIERSIFNIDDVGRNANEREENSSPCALAPWTLSMTPSIRILGNERDRLPSTTIPLRMAIVIRRPKTRPINHAPRIPRAAVEIDDTETRSFRFRTPHRVLSLCRRGSVVLRKVTFTLTRARGCPAAIVMTAVSPFLFAERQKQRQRPADARGGLRRYRRVSMTKSINHTYENKRNTWLAKTSSNSERFFIRRFKVNNSILYPEICEWWVLSGPSATRWSNEKIV